MKMEQMVESVMVCLLDEMAAKLEAKMDATMTKNRRRPRWVPLPPGLMATMKRWRPGQMREHQPLLEVSLPTDQKRKKK
jgi:hypothetical protein